MIILLEVQNGEQRWVEIKNQWMKAFTKFGNYSVPMNFLEESQKGKICPNQLQKTEKEILESDPLDQLVIRLLNEYGIIIKPKYQELPVLTFVRIRILL